MEKPKQNLIYYFNSHLEWPSVVLQDLMFKVYKVIFILRMSNLPIRLMCLLLPRDHEELICDS